MKYIKAGITVVPELFEINDTTGKVWHLHSKNTETDTDMLQRFRSAVAGWCVQNGMLNLESSSQPGLPGTLTPNVARDDHQLQRRIFELNFAGLFVQEHLDDFLATLQDTTMDLTHTRMRALYVYLVTHLDSAFLNRYVNKLIFALATVTGSAAEPDAMAHWQNIFRQVPELWVIYAIQVEMYLATERFSLL